MFTTDHVLLYLAYTGMLGAALAERSKSRRVLIAFSAVMLGVRAVLSPMDLVTLVWMTIIVLTCIILISRPFVRNASVRFSTEETQLRTAIFDALPASEARHLMTQGWWVNATAGETLTRQGQPIESLVFLATGRAQVLVNGRQVGTCDAGDLIGEATALTGTFATATVVLETASRLWCIKAATLRAYIAANPDVVSALERSFRIALRAKLMASNQAIASARSAQRD